MAADAAPTLVSITTEGLKKGGYSSPSSAQLTRAQDEWMPEIKNDIFTLAKKLKVLQTIVVGITTEGVDRYALPSDFSSDLTLTLLDGLSTGIAQGGASGSITLAATETVSEATLKQKKGILVYEGTGKGSYSQVTAYNSTTKVATVSPNFNTAPVNLDKYMFVDTVTPVTPKPVWKLDRMIQVNGGSGTPLYFYPIGDADNGEFVLYPKPYRSTSIPWGMQLRYYCDLMRLDLAGTLITTLYRRWRNIFTHGVYAKALQDKDDKRAEKAEVKYQRMLSTLITRETYGTDLSNLQCTLED
jgi:hypothetical protein